MYGKDFTYAGSRIRGTIVRLLKDNEPVYVHEVSARGVCSISMIEQFNQRMLNVGEDGAIIHVHLDELNMEPVPLGYVNNGGRAFYLTRVPVRRGPGNQGLTGNNCQSSAERLWNFPNKSLRQSILGNFPAFKKAVEESKTRTRSGGIKSIAFDRHWAICGGIILYYKEMEVGTIEDGVPVLSSSFTYLKEALAELT